MKIDGGGEETKTDVGVSEDTERRRNVENDDGSVKIIHLRL